MRLVTVETTPSARVVAYTISCRRLLISVAEFEVSIDLVTARLVEAILVAVEVVPTELVSVDIELETGSVESVDVCAIVLVAAAATKVFGSKVPQFAFSALLQANSALGSPADELIQVTKVSSQRK